MKKFHKKKLIRFKKDEINKIMEIYSKKISIGEWKDYSISFKNNYAIFSIHKSYKFGPTFEIKKNFSGRKVIFCREITKLYEEFIRKDIDELEQFEKEPKGEITVVISEKKNN